jgi:hypothetical protein
LIEEHGCACCTQIKVIFEHIGLSLDKVKIINFDTKEYSVEDYASTAKQLWKFENYP